MHRHSTTKTLPGSACKGQNFNTRDELTYGRNGLKLDGYGSGETKVMCPVLKDITNSAVDAAYVVVDPASGGSNTMSCRFTTRNKYGSGSWGAIKYASGTSLQTLTLNTGITGWTYGSAQIQCDLEEDDRVISYRWAE